jgi:hypothetical protein
VTREQIFYTSVSFLNSSADVTKRTQAQWPDNFEISTEQATEHEPQVENDYKERKIMIILSITIDT